MAVIVVSRIHSNKNITYAMFVVDLYCLGVKDSFWKFNQHPLDFKTFIEKKIRRSGDEVPIIETNYPLVHNIIFGAVEFAENFGFYPHKDFELSKYILDEDDEKIDLLDIEFGYKSKPFFISNPDNSAEAQRVMAHLDKRLGREHYYFIKEEDLDNFKAEQESLDEQMNSTPVVEDVDYYDPEVKKQLITGFLSYEGNSKKMTETPYLFMDQALAEADIIYYTYILTAEDIQKTIDTISDIFDFEMTTERLPDEMIMGITSSKYEPSEIRAEAMRIIALAECEDIKKMQKDLDVALKKFPGIPVFQYLHLRLLQIKGSDKAFHHQVRAYLDNNPSYYPFKILKVIDFLTYNPEKIPRSISKDFYLRNFFEARDAFCPEEVLLYIQALTMNYAITGQYALLEQMYLYMEDTYPGFFPDEKTRSMKALKIPYLLDWCKEWIKNNS